MPIRPFAVTWFCRSCDWKTTVRPASDALGPFDAFEKCPRCDGPVGSRSPTPFERVLSTDVTQPPLSSGIFQA
jgi:hypothetical protein